MARFLFGIVTELHGMTTKFEEPLRYLLTELYTPKIGYFLIFW